MLVGRSMRLGHWGLFTAPPLLVALVDNLLKGCSSDFIMCALGASQHLAALSQSVEDSAGTVLKAFQGPCIPTTLRGFVSEGSAGRQR